MREEDFFNRLRQVTERFLSHEATWDELWRTFCLGFYTEQLPEGSLSTPLGQYWDGVYELVYMSQPDSPSAEDRAVGLIGEEDLRSLLAGHLARGLR